MLCAVLPDGQSRAKCLVAGHCWDPVGPAIVDYSYYFECLQASLFGEG
jgi:hypothetical protein